MKISGKGSPPNIRVMTLKTSNPCRNLSLIKVEKEYGSENQTGCIIHHFNLHVHKMFQEK